MVLLMLGIILAGLVGYAVIKKAKLGPAATPVIPPGGTTATLDDGSIVSAPNGSTSSLADGRVTLQANGYNPVSGTVTSGRFTADPTSGANAMTGPDGTLVPIGTPLATQTQQDAINTGVMLQKRALAGGTLTANEGYQLHLAQGLADNILAEQLDPLHDPSSPSCQGFDAPAWCPPYGVKAAGPPAPPPGAVAPTTGGNYVAPLPNGQTARSGAGHF